MTKPKDEEDVKRNTAMGATVAAGIIGAAVGATAVALSNKDTRAQIKKSISDLGEKGKELVEKAQTSAEHYKESAEATIHDKKQKLSTIADDVKAL